MTSTELGVIGATFLASAVEIVETFTMLLAMGVTRGWRSTLAGAAAALLVLVVITVVAGYTLVTLIPEAALQLVIGTLLLVFGMQWLRKAVLRASGRKALHDEAAIYARETAEARAAGRQPFLGLDGFAFVVAFKGVLLEGLEVVIIVLTIGLSAGNVPLAVTGALLAVIPVSLLAIAVRGPLSRVPENAIKSMVGLLLCTFGAFWAIEGLGYFAADHASLEWPMGDASIAVILAVWVLVAWISVRWLSRARPRSAAAGPDGPAVTR